MFPGHQYYGQCQFKPKTGGSHNWHVWCETGALQVLSTGEYKEWLEKNHDLGGYTVNFANGSAARIHPTHPLWQKLEEIAETHTVEVFPLNFFNATYEPWDGTRRERSFDAIKISQKSEVAA